MEGGRKTYYNRILKRSGHSLYIRPHSLLMPFIAHYTISWPKEKQLQAIESSLQPETLTLVPDASGCIVINCGNGAVRNILWGPTTELVEVEKNMHDEQITIMIEFLPTGAYGLFRESQHGLKNLKLELDEVDLVLDLKIKHLLEQATGVEQLIEGIDYIFLSQMTASGLRKIEASVVNQLILQPKELSIPQLCQSSAYSERHLNRLFNEELGMNMRTFISLKRVNKSIKLMKAWQGSFAELATELGYYDQSHFIHDFKNFCGVTPNSYKKQMSSFYNENFKF